MKRAQTGPNKWMHTEKELKGDFLAEDNPIHVNNMYSDCFDGDE